MRYGSLFSGYGGLDLAVEEVFDAEPAWHSDNDRDAARVLRHRWPGVPNIGDVTAIEDPSRLFATRWEDLAPVDIVCGGFPCQDISRAGKGAGLTEGTRSGLWFEMARAVRVLRPSVVVVENVPLLRSRGLDRVLGDLSEVGYDAAWSSLRASDVGAPHRRERVFLVAHPSDADPLRWRPGPGLREEGPTRVGWRRPPNDDGPARTPTNPGRERHGRREVVGMVGGMGPAATGRGRDPGPAREVVGDRSTTALADPGGTGSQGPIGLQPAGTQRPAIARNGGVDWRQYRGAVERWEAITGRPAPDPVDRAGRLAPLFVEWLMGLPAGWVTDVVDRRAALRLLGNGVVPLQAVAALRGLVGR